MTKLESAVFEAAKLLNPKLRLRLADELRNSDESSMSPEWIAEIDRRAARVDAGETKPIPGETVMRRLRSSLLKKRSANGRRGL